METIKDIKIMLVLELILILVAFALCYLCTKEYSFYAGLGWFMASFYHIDKFTSHWAALIG